ncbi:M91 family zinc metallopeptidase [Prosthecomicrobium sp. N25]|uniref:M91 family zinc metallopeptidase n=1 Tax=Prosthecomicrobium sp. N25 TaxID=3129254 RepID=UPI0030781D4A
MANWRTEFRKKLRPRVSASDFDDLEHNFEWDRSFKIAENLEIRYIPFSGWMEVYDKKEIRPFDVNVRSYRVQRKLHYDSVADAVRLMLKYVTGRTLLAALGDQGETVRVFPYFDWGKDNFNATASKNDPADGTWAGEPQRDSDGHPVKNGFTGTGVGSDATVRISTFMWGEHGTSGKKHPGSTADEVLFHELVHAYRYMDGAGDRRKVTAGYQNEEEFMAVVVTNIYLSEKKQLILRGDHGHGARSMSSSQFLDNVQNINPPPRQILDRFKSRQPRFYRDLAAIRGHIAPFNPIRVHRHEAGFI